MCAPKIEKPKAPPPPPAAPPRPQETATAYKRSAAPAEQRNSRQSRTGIDTLRVDLSVPGGGAGVNVPKG